MTTDSISELAEKLVRESFSFEEIELKFAQALQMQADASATSQASLLSENKRFREAIEKALPELITFNRFLASRYHTCRVCESAWGPEQEKHYDWCPVPKLSQALSQQTEVDPSPSISEVERKVIEAARAWDRKMFGESADCLTALVQSLHEALEALPPVKGGG